MKVVLEGVVRRGYDDITVEGRFCEFSAGGELTLWGGKDEMPVVTWYMRPSEDPVGHVCAWKTDTGKTYDEATCDFRAHRISILP